MVEKTTSRKWLELTKQALEEVFSNIEGRGYFLLAMLGYKKEASAESNDRPYWIPELTKEVEPLKCSEGNLGMVKKIAFLAMDERSTNADTNKDKEFLCFLKTALVIPMEEKWSQKPRSIILIGRGAVCCQAESEKIIDESLTTYNSRISAIGIGNGVSELFLRTVTVKGGGLFEIVSDEGVSKKMVENLTKRLRMPYFGNVKFDWSSSPNVGYILPVIKEKQTFLKGVQFAVVVYFKEETKNPKIKEQSPTEAEKKSSSSIKMTYIDSETKNEASLIFEVKHYEGSHEKEIHKLLINQLLFSKQEIDSVASSLDTYQGKLAAAFRDHCGGDGWASNLAVEYQILSKWTAYLAEPEPVDISMARQPLKMAEDKVIVPNLLASELLHDNSQTTQSLKSVLHEKSSSSSFSSSKFNLMRRKVSPMKADIISQSSMASTTCTDQLSRDSCLDSSFLKENNRDFLETLFPVDSNGPQLGNARPNRGHFYMGDEPLDLDSNPEIVKHPKSTYPIIKPTKEVDLSKGSELKEIVSSLKAQQLDQDGLFIVDTDLLTILRIDIFQLQAQAAACRLTEAEVILFLALFYFYGQKECKAAYDQAYRLAVKIMKKKVKEGEAFDITKVREKIAGALKVKVK